MNTCSKVLSQWLASRSQPLVSSEQDERIVRWVEQQPDLSGNDWYLVSDDEGSLVNNQYDLHGRMLEHFFENNWSVEHEEFTDPATTCFVSVEMSENMRLRFLHIALYADERSIYFFPRNAHELLSIVV